MKDLSVEDIPAFPIKESLEFDAMKKYHLGMTLRDWFAGQALIAFVGGYNIHEEDIKESVKKAVELSYMLADQMLKERAK